MWFFFELRPWEIERLLDEEAERATHFPVDIFDRLEFVQDVPHYRFKAGDVGTYSISAFNGGSQIVIKGQFPTNIKRAYLNLWIEQGIVAWSVPQREWQYRKNVTKFLGGW